MRLEGRVQALEKRTVGGFKPWYRIIQDIGQTEEEAVAAYEAESGPIGDDDCILRVIIRKP